MIRLNTPLDEDTVRKLRCGDEILLDGIIVTARDAAHKYLVSEKPQDVAGILKDSVIYHCGPIMRKERDRWTVVGAGPTTSIREEPYEADVIRHYRVRGVIGKGGMGARTLAALRECGAVYLHTTGGASAKLAAHMPEVLDVKKLEFGTPEAMWVIRVKDFPCLVTMDSHGNSLHDLVEKASKEVFDSLLGKG